MNSLTAGICYLSYSYPEDPAEFWPIKGTQYRLNVPFSTLLALLPFCFLLEILGTGLSSLNVALAFAVESKFNDLCTSHVHGPVAGARYVC